MKSLRPLIIAAPFLTALPAHADHVILDDCIIDGSLAVGLDSVNGEAFGFDTVRLKENNLRLHFDDTSTAAAFPRNDWRLIANDSANGGDSYLGIEDSTAGRIPFRVEAGARSNALFIESSGDIGIGTNNPAVDVHISTGDTPTVRLEQNGTSGWSPQTWDVAGNETNFFIRDVTNGSKLPFRIRPNAPTSSLDIEGTTGDVGIGTAGPSADLHVRRTSAIDTEPMLRLESANASTPPTVPMLSVDAAFGSGAVKVGQAFISGDRQSFVRVSFSNNNWHNGTAWSANSEDNVGGTFQIRDDAFYWHSTTAGAGIPTFTLQAVLDNAGNLDLAGTVGMISDRNQKADIVEVDTASVLERLAEMPIATWRYKKESDVIHMGPMAQDFWSAFELGKGETRLYPSDTAAVALASSQELYKRLQAKEARIEDLEQRNVDLEKRLERLEKALLGAQ